MSRGTQARGQGKAGELLWPGSQGWGPQCLRAHSGVLTTTHRAPAMGPFPLQSPLCGATLFPWPHQHPRGLLHLSLCLGTQVRADVTECPLCPGLCWGPEPGPPRSSMGRAAPAHPEPSLRGEISGSPVALGGERTCRQTWPGSPQRAGGPRTFGGRDLGRAGWRERDPRAAREPRPRVPRSERGFGSVPVWTEARHR